jgi:hypothetical protein
MCESRKSVYNGAFDFGGEHILTAQLLARILMWVVIISLVWYFAQQWNRSAPSEKEREAMLDAAHSYREYKARVQQGEGGMESDVPQPQTRH